MAISTFCLGCRSLLRLPDDMAGKQVRCQKCNQLFMVPGVLASGQPKPAAPSVKLQPRPEPKPAAPPVAPPSAPPLPMATPRVTPPPPISRTESAPPADGVPAVMLVEVPTRPTPPPLEDGKPAPSGRTEPRAPARRDIPPMNLSARERPRRTNRPRRPTSVLAGLALTIMGLLFVGLLFASGGTWLWAVSRQQFNNNGPFVQQQPQQQQFFPPKAGGPVIQPMPFPPNGVGGKGDGAKGSGQVFNPGPPGPRFNDKLAKPIKLTNGSFTSQNEQLSNNDSLDPVRRQHFDRFAPLRPLPLQQLPCKVFLVELEANKRYLIDYKRTQPIDNANELRPDPYLRIESQDGQRLVEHDDIAEGENTDSRIEFIPPKTGTYRIFCTLHQFLLPAGPMNFALSIRADGTPLPQPRATNQLLAKKQTTEGDLAIVAMPKPIGPADTLGELCWSVDGKAFFVFYNNGTLTRVAVDTLIEERRLELGKAPGNGSMVMSAQGLVVAIPSMNEVWLVNPDDLSVKKRFGVFTSVAVASSPALDFAFVATTSPLGRGLLVLDLAKDTPLRFLDAPNQGPVASPDGALLFVMSNDVLLAFEIKADGQLVQKQGSGQLGFNQATPRRIEVSPDGKFVCVAGSIAPANLPNHPNVGRCPAYMYPVTDLSKPSFAISTEIALRAVGFDPRADRIFAHANGAPLVVFDGTGKQTARFSLPNTGVGQEPLQFLTHPDSNKVLIRFPSKLCLVTFKPNIKAPVVKAEPTFPLPTPLKDAETLALAPFPRGDVTYRELQLPNFGKIEPCWDADGQALFHLEPEGILTRIRANDFVPQTSLSLGKPVSAMALSGKGLLVALRDQPEVWLIDPRDLKVQRRIPCTSPATHLASGPKLSVAAAVGAEAMLLDLTFRNLPRGLPVKPVADQPFQNPALTSDGTYLFLSQAGPGSSKVLRIRIDKDPPVLEESRDTPVKAAHAFCIHGDHVAWYSPLTRNKKQETEFYKVGDWTASAFTLPERARAMATASDGSLYVQTHDNKTMVFAQPAKGDAAPAALPWVGGRIRDIVPHPQQPRRFLASTDKTVFQGER